MSKITRLVLALVCLLAAGVLAGCTQPQERAEFLPEAANDQQLAILPEDWQFLTTDWQEAENVPELLLVQGEENIRPMQFGYSWSHYIDREKGEVQGFIACGMHPLDAQPDLPRLEPGESVTLVWQAEPTQYGVTAYAYDEWQQRTCGNTEPEEITHTNVALLEGLISFDLLADEHSYVYVIDAKWEDENAPGLGGSSEWAFYVE